MDSACCGSLNEKIPPAPRTNQTAGFDGYVLCAITSHSQNSQPSLVCATFSQTFVAFVLFSRGYSFHLDCFGNWFTIKFTFCIIKAKLAGDFCWSDIIKHKGYSARSPAEKEIKIRTSLTTADCRFINDLSIGHLNSWDLSLRVQFQIPLWFILQVDVHALVLNTFDRKHKAGSLF